MKTCKKKEPAEELNKLIIKKIFKKVHSSFIGNIWGTDLADMQLISKFDKRIHFFYYVLLITSVNTHGLFHLNKKGCSITSAF